VSKRWLIVGRLNHTDPDAHTQRRDLQRLLRRSGQTAQLVMALVVVDGLVRMVRMLVRMRVVLVRVRGR